MARTMHEVVEPADHDADRAAWVAAAEARKFATKNGDAYIYHNGAIAPLPPIAGFAGLDPALQGLVFQAYAQFVRYRVGQNLNDESLVSAIAKVSSGESVPAAKDNDAFESAYFDGISDAVAAKLGDLDDDATAEEKKNRATIVADTMDKYRSSERYAAILDAAVEAGKVVAPKRERKARGKKAKTSTAVEL